VNSDEERDAARKIVAQVTSDVSEEFKILDMLGLLVSDEEEELDD
jgi:hypothetical protein